MSDQISDLVQGTLPGATEPPRTLPAPYSSLRERPWRIFRDGSSNWAIYVIRGNRLSEVTVDSITTAHQLGLKTAIVAASGTELAAAAAHFATIRTHVICSAAGRPHLIGPPAKQTRSTKSLAKSKTTRVPLDLLQELSSSTTLDRQIRTRIRRLCTQYEGFSGKRAERDEQEQKALGRFAESTLRSMGFKAGTIGAAEVVRNLELAGWGGSRDHFFHSFQNHFFGLFAIEKLPEHFNIWKDAARVQFDASPHHVWFLTALWHDVGYGIEKFGDVTDNIFSVQPEESIAEFAKAGYLRNAAVQNALRMISCLTVQLLMPPRNRHPWTLPGLKWRRLPEEGEIASALSENVMEGSHGAAGALRLYTDFTPQIERMRAVNQAALRGTLLLACCSIPFHDFRFRDGLRRRVGSCTIPTRAMPFAGLLAFIDSIQDDRRDLKYLQDEVRCLARLLTRPPATVAAEVNQDAIGNSDFLWKMVEARDVLGSLGQGTDQLCFEYPSWMVA